MSELLYVLEPSFETGPLSFKATLPPAIAPSVQTTRPRPTITTDWLYYGIRHSEPKQRADSVYIYIYIYINIYIYIYICICIQWQFGVEFSYKPTLCDIVAVYFLLKFLLTDTDVTSFTLQVRRRRCALWSPDKSTLLSDVDRNLETSDEVANLDNLTKGLDLGLKQR